MNLLIIGFGKMGKAVAELAEARGHRIAGVMDLHNRADYAVPPGTDVAIEFTSPESAVDNILFCFNHRLPVVCGSTGWYPHLEAVKQQCAAQNGALLYASNFSVGVNVFFKVSAYLARLMSRRPEYRVHIDETHHTQKKDAPSGTAITLAEVMLREMKDKTEWTLPPATQPHQLEIRSHRIGDTPGTHIVTYQSPADTVTLSHKAHTRTGFALGAVLAAEFLAGKTGVYTMDDVLTF
jgi:4-hydroxy-tetrahydrodipicolinate reductase